MRKIRYWKHRFYVWMTVWWWLDWGWDIPPGPLKSWLTKENG